LDTEKEELRLESEDRDDILFTASFSYVAEHGLKWDDRGRPEGGQALKEKA
jgi:hypothetical protein